MNHQHPLQERTPRRDRGTKPAYIPRKPRINILIVPTQNSWMAKVHRADTGSVIYESEPYADKQYAAGDARRWAYKNSHPIGKISGLR